MSARLSPLYDSGMSKRGFVLTLVALALAGSGCRRSAEKSAYEQEPPSTLPPIIRDVSVEELAAAPEGAADEDGRRKLAKRYGGQRLRVTARIARVGKSKMNQPLLTLVGHENPNVAIGASYDGPVTPETIITLICGSVRYSDMTVALGSCEREGG